MSTLLDDKTKALFTKYVSHFDNEVETERTFAIKKAGELLRQHKLKMVDLPAIYGSAGGASSGADAAMSAMWEQLYFTEVATVRELRRKADSLRDQANLARDSWIDTEQEAQRLRAEIERYKKVKSEEFLKSEECASGCRVISEFLEASRAEDKKWRKGKAARDAVVRIYGSTPSDVLAPCPREKLLRKATKPWTVYRPGSSRHPVAQSLDGWVVDRQTLDIKKRGSTQVYDAIENAYPMPATIQDAWVEYAYWDRRRYEIRLFSRYRTNADDLDGAAMIRQEIVLSLAVEHLRAQSLADVRFRCGMVPHVYKDEYPGHEDIVARITESTQRDLDALSPGGKAAETVVDYAQFRAASQERQKPVKPAAPKRRVAAGQTEFGF